MISNILLRRAVNFGVLSNDMILTSRMSDSLIPIVVSAARRDPSAAEPIRRTNERAYASGPSSLVATDSSQLSSRVCFMRRRTSAMAG